MNIINSFVLGSLESRSQRLATALEKVGDDLLNFEGISEEDGQGFYAVLSCLADVAQNLNIELAEIRVWAEKTGLDVSFKPDSTTA